MAKKPKASARDRLRKFQQKAGLEVTGRYDSVTRRNLKLARKGKPLQTPKAKTARRKERAEKLANDPAQITQPLTPKLLDQEVEAQTRLKFGAAERQLQDEQRVSVAQRPRIDQAYQTYLQRVQEAQFAQKAQNDQTMAQVEANAAKDTAPEGASPEGQQAAQARQALSRSFGSLLATQGQNHQNNLFDQQRITELRRQQAHGEEDNRAKGLAQKVQELQREKGDYGVSVRTAARASERNFGLQQAALGQKAEQAETQEKLARKKQRIEQQLAESLIGDRKSDNRRQSAAERRKAKLKRRDQQIAQQNADANTRRANRPPARSGGGSRGGSGGSGGKKQSAADRKRILDGRSAIVAARGAFNEAGRNWNRYVKRGRKAGQNDAILRAGYELERQGYIGPNTNRLLRQLGVKVPSGWTRAPGSRAGGPNGTGRL